MHGLTRNGRDFDRLAASLQDTRRLYCPDIAGRGLSDDLPDPALYAYPQYMADMTSLIARMTEGQETPAIDWIGTSMGGILGMLMAAAPGSPIRRLVINDVGPFISLASLKRIADYTAMRVAFADLAQLERHVRAIYAPFGITRDEDWRHLAAHSARRLPNGQLTLAHDPAIAANFRTLKEDVNFWDAYDSIRCPVLLLHGKLSDVLSAETAQEMTRRGPRAQLVAFDNVGHAPALMDKDQIAVIRDFIDI